MKFFLLALYLLPALALAQAQNTLVILGDSLSDGYGVARENSYPHLLEKNLPKWKIVNSSISGSTSASGPGRVAWTLKSKPTAVLLALGGNDGLRGLEPKELKKNLDATITAFQKAGVKVLLAGMRAAPNYGKEYGDRFFAIYPALAKEKKVPLYGFLLEGVAGDSKLNQPDGIHPNEAGQKILAEKLLPFLQKELP